MILIGSLGPIGVGSKFSARGRGYQRHCQECHAGALARSFAPSKFFAMTEAVNMSHYALELPDPLLGAARKVAKRNNTPVNQLFALAIAEKLSALETAELLVGRSETQDFERYLAVLDLVPDVPPLPGDELDRAVSKIDIEDHG